ncbi:MAG: GNAT family N-acetyltransferase [Bacteroidota bacterium]
MQIVISSATDRYDLAHLYLESHKATLRHYKVTGISTLSSSWKYNPNAHMIIALCPDTSEMLGAVRLEISGGSQTIPMAQALRSIGYNISNLVSRLADNGGVAELCGLWCRPDNTVKGLPKKLIAKALEYAKKIKISHIIGFANEYSFPTVESLGFTHANHLENQGTFYYPTKKYKTYVVHYSDQKNKQVLLNINTASDLVPLNN